MDSEKDISILRTNISMSEKFTQRMKDYSKISDVPFSSLVRDALRLYTNDLDDCFVVLARQHSGSEAADFAAKAIKEHGIKQNHLLGHIIREASKSLCELEKGQDWHEIKCIIPANENSGPPKNPHLEDDVAAIEAQIDRNTKTRKKAG